MSDQASRSLRVFLCHSSGDKPTVRELGQRLDAEGWIDAWLDEKKLYPGEDWSLEIEKAVEAADVILVCLTNNSVTTEGYVQRELRIVLDQADYKPEGTLFIIPVRLEECEPPRRLRRWQYADYFPQKDRDRAYQRLLVSLRNRAKSLGILAESRKIESVIKTAKSGDVGTPSENITFTHNVKLTDSPESKRIRVLIVDDVSESIENIRKLLLLETDLEVVGVARNGREAIQLSRELNPNVVLMDINLPDMDGYKAIKLIRSKRPTVQVVTLSVQGDRNSMRRAMLAGANDFITKPPMEDELINAIRRAVKYKIGR